MYREMIRFIDQPIEVIYNEPPVLEKVPRCPQGFTWNKQDFLIRLVVAEWIDLQRKGRNAKNMTPSHAARAILRGSWGVGRFFFRVQVHTGELFDIYYDRAPGRNKDRKGGWYLLGERKGSSAEKNPYEHSGDEKQGCD